MMVSWRAVTPKAERTGELGRPWQVHVSRVRYLAIDKEGPLLLYERSEHFRNWCIDRHAREPVWLDLYDCERCIMEKDVFPFFSELEGVITDRTYRYNTLVTERSFLTGPETRIALLEWALVNTSGKFTLIERNGWEGILFDTLGDYTIARLMFSENQAVIERSTRGFGFDVIRNPSSWHRS